MLNKGTLKFWVTDGMTSCQAIGFGMAGLAVGLAEAKGVELVYTPKRDTWREVASVILEVEDMFLK